MAKHAVVQPNTDGYVKVRLHQPIEGLFIVEGFSIRKALISNIASYGCTTLKVVNDSNSFITFKKGKVTGHAEPITYVYQSNKDYCSVSSVSVQAQEAQQKDTFAQDLPDHLKSMYKDNISGLSDHQKLQFKDLISEFSDVFAKDDSDLGCISGVEHKIQTHNEIPISELHSNFRLQHFWVSLISINMIQFHFRQ